MAGSVTATPLPSVTDYCFLRGSFKPDFRRLPARVKLGRLGVRVSASLAEDDRVIADDGKNDPDKMLMEYEANGSSRRSSNGVAYKVVENSGSFSLNSKSNGSAVMSTNGTARVSGNGSARSRALVKKTIPDGAATGDVIINGAIGDKRPASGGSARVNELGQEVPWFKQDGRENLQVSVAAGGQWNRFKTYSTIQRSIEIWGFVITFLFKAWVNNQKFMYKGNK